MTTLPASDVPPALASAIQVTPNLADLDAAIASLSAAGGGDIHIPAGTLTGSTVTLRSNVYLKGRGRGVTTLKLANGVNADLLMGQDAYSYFGTTNNLGISNFGLEDLTLDGNRANNSNGSCVALYGYKFFFKRVEVLNSPLFGIRTDGGQIVPRAMESHWDDILIDTTGNHGIFANGPHDSMLNNVVVIDAGQLGDNGYYGIYFGPTMNARCSALHTWHTSNVANRVYAGFVDEGGSSDIVNSHFEGARTVNAVFHGTGTQTSNCRFYASYGPDTVAIRAPEVRLHGYVSGGVAGPGNGNRGVILGYAPSDNVSFCDIDVYVHQCAAGAVAFNNSQGNNDVRVRGYADGAGSYGFVGTPISGSDFGYVRINGAQNNRLWTAAPQ